MENPNPPICNWLHCNKCSSTFHPQLKFFLAECGHIFCEKCVRRMDANKQCSVCGRPISYVEITGNMEQSIKLFFQPIDKQLKKILDICQFQMQHKDKLLDILTEKYCNAKKIWSQNMQTILKLEKENQALRALIKRYPGQHPQYPSGNSSIDGSGSAGRIRPSGNDSFNNTSAQSLQSLMNLSNQSQQKNMQRGGSRNNIITPIHNGPRGKYLLRPAVRLTPIQERFENMPPLSVSTSLDQLKKPPFGNRN